MCNHTAVAKTFVMAACILAIALLTIGMGVNYSSWAGSNQPSGLILASISPTPSIHRRVMTPKNNRLALACAPEGGCCSWLSYFCSSGGPTPCCAGLFCDHEGSTGTGVCSSR